MRIPLIIRYTAISSLILLIVMGVFAFTHINKVQKVFAEKAMHEADVISAIILRDFYYMMLEDNREKLQLMVEEVAKAPRVKRIRILGKEGIISFSNNTSEIGTALSHQDESCVFCHLPGSKALVDAPIEKRSRVFADQDGNQFLSITRGVYNDPNCYTASCHAHTPREKKVGVLDMVVSLDRMVDLSHAHHADVMTSTVIMLVVLSLGHYFITRKYICDPIEVLLANTKALSAGDLSVRVKNPSKDELGELGQSFNSMAENLTAAQVELKAWGNTLEQKVEERTSEMQDMHDQLVRSAKLASMGEMIAGVAHEINNPLSGIMMFASLSARQEGLPPQVKENLDLIVSETGRCAKIVRGLLEFARESIPEKKSASINQVLQQTLGLVAQQSIFQDVEICFDPSEQLPDIEIDTDQLEQVFLNMFINAGQAMPQGGYLTIRTCLLEDERQIEVVIQDTGTGISDENINRIFDPFFTSKEEKGFGLGLSISYGIIRNHGGTVDVYSREGEGTRFSIKLPIEPVTMSPEQYGR